jgi:hypothetical protein
VATSTGWPLAWVVGGLSLGLAGLALAPTLPAWLAAWAVLGLGMGAGLCDAAFATLGRLYGQGARGAITNLTLFGGFASTVCWPLSAFLVEALGWRGTCLAYAGLQLAVALPIHLVLLPRNPPILPVTTPAGLPRGNPARAGLPPSTRRRRATLLLLLAAGLTLGSMIQSVVSVHLLTTLQARGIELAAAVGLGALVGPSQVGARVIEKLLGGRFHPIWTMLASVSLVAAGLGLLWADFPILAVCLILYGAGVGINSIARGTLPLTLFGGAGYAALMGRLALPMLGASALAPPAGAFLLERIGASAMLGALVGAALANVVLVAALLLLVGRGPIAAP